ncbi:putative NPH3 domain-containing protein [Helianthus debilis subsp. tardiflorus]
MQLDQATLEDLLMPNFSYSMETLYNLECVLRMVQHFMATDQATGGASPCSIKDEYYLVEVAPDVNLKLTKFMALAEAVLE